MRRQTKPKSADLYEVLCAVLWPLQRAWVKQVAVARQRPGRSACTEFLIVDAQRVKKADTADLKGDDAGKNISGIERRIAVNLQRDFTAPHESPSCTEVTRHRPTS